MHQKKPPILEYTTPPARKDPWLIAGFAGGWLAGVALGVCFMMGLAGRGGVLIWQLALYGTIAGLPVFAIVRHRARTRPSDWGTAFVAGLLSAPPIMFLLSVIAILNFRG